MGIQKQWKVLHCPIINPSQNTRFNFCFTLLSKVFIYYKFILYAFLKTEVLLHVFLIIMYYLHRLDNLTVDNFNIVRTWRIEFDYSNFLYEVCLKKKSTMLNLHNIT